MIMKLLVQIFVVGLASVGFVFGTSPEGEGEPHVQGQIEDMINKTINKLLADLPDEIGINSFSLNFTNDLLFGEASILDFKLRGLKELVASRIDVSLLRLTMNATIQIPKIEVDTKYFANVTLMNLLPLYGNGPISVVIENIDILVFGKLNIKSDLSISNITVSFGLQDALFDLHGLYNNEDLSLFTSNVLHDTIAPFLNENRDLISQVVSHLAEKIINGILSGGSNSTELLEVLEDIETSETVL